MGRLCRALGHPGRLEVKEAASVYRHLARRWEAFSERLRMAPNLARGSVARAALGSYFQK